MPALTPPDPAAVRTIVTLPGSTPLEILRGFAGITTMAPGPAGRLVEMRADQAATLVGSGWATPYVIPPSTGWAG